MRTLGYMPTEMELIEISQHIKMRSEWDRGAGEGTRGRWGAEGVPFPPQWVAAWTSRTLCR